MRINGIREIKEFPPIGRLLVQVPPAGTIVAIFPIGTTKPAALAEVEVQPRSHQGISLSARTVLICVKRIMRPSYILDRHGKNLANWQSSFFCCRQHFQSANLE